MYIPPDSVSGGEPLRDTWRNRLLAEVATLLSFCSIADRQGLPVPNGPKLREELVGLLDDLIRGLTRSSANAANEWPPREAEPALVAWTRVKRQTGIFVSGSSAIHT